MRKYYTYTDIDSEASIGLCNGFVYCFGATLSCISGSGHGSGEGYGYGNGEGLCDTFEYDQLACYSTKIFDNFEYCYGYGYGEGNGDGTGIWGDQ